MDGSTGKFLERPAAGPKAWKIWKSPAQRQRPRSRAETEGGVSWRGHLGYHRAADATEMGKHVDYNHARRQIHVHVCVCVYIYNHMHMYVYIYIYTHQFK